MKRKSVYFRNIMHTRARGFDTLNRNHWSIMYRGMVWSVCLPHVCLSWRRGSCPNNPTRQSIIYWLVVCNSGGGRGRCTPGEPPVSLLPCGFKINPLINLPVSTGVRERHCLPDPRVALPEPTPNTWGALTDRSARRSLQPTEENSTGKKELHIHPSYCFSNWIKINVFSPDLIVDRSHTNAEREIAEHDAMCWKIDFEKIFSTCYFYINPLA